MWPLMLLVGFGVISVFSPISSSGVGWLRNSTRQSDRHIVYWIAQLTLTGPRSKHHDSVVRTSFFVTVLNIEISLHQSRPTKTIAVLFYLVEQLYRALFLVDDDRWWSIIPPWRGASVDDGQPDGEQSFMSASAAGLSLGGGHPGSTFGA